MQDNRIFPQVVEVSAQLETASYEKKCIFHERLLYRYLTKNIAGWSIKDFLDKEGIEDYALYAVTDFTKLFLKDLDRNTKEKEISQLICDRNSQEFCHGFIGRRVISLDELANKYKRGKIRKVIVMSVLHENEIFDELLEIGILLNDIISFVSVLYS